METIPQDMQGLLLLVLALGLRHGFDPDHLATIEGIARLNSGTRMARWSGILFSLGHGGVVMATVWLLGILASSWQVPEWMNLLGAWISIAFLTLIGAVNLIAVLRAAPNQIVQTVGIKGRVLGRLTSATNPLAVGMVGALFALSFDTMSQAALFAVAGTQFGSAGFSLILGLVFMAGMMITDGLHGIWVVRMLNRANELAIIASRVMGLAVASLSLIVALYGFMRLISPTIDVAGEGKELTLGVCIMATMGLSYIVAVMVTRRRA